MFANETLTKTEGDQSAFVACVPLIKVILYTFYISEQSTAYVLLGVTFGGWLII